MDAFPRRALKGIRELHPDVIVEVLRQKKHIVLEVKRPGINPRHITLSLSPKNEDHAVVAVVREARRALNLEKP